MNIYMHVERLVLDGISIHANQGSILKATVESELKELLVLDGIPSRIHSGVLTHAIRGGTIYIEANPQPLSLGQQIARAVYGGIGK